MLKWIGGASAAIALALGIAVASGDRLFPATDAPSSTLAESIPVDPAKVPLSDERVPDQALQASEAADAPFVIKRILPINGPIKYGEWHWDDKDVPPGPLVVTVDLEARVISVFRDGYEIGAAAVLLGTQEHPTPLGTFPILQKKRHNISTIYDVPMPYTMRLTWDGIAIHASEVENGYASHGCIGTPEEFAAKLFAVIETGDKVIITRGKTLALGDAIVS